MLQFIINMNNNLFIKLFILPAHPFLFILKGIRTEKLYIKNTVYLWLIDWLIDLSIL